MKNIVFLLLISFVIVSCTSEKKHAPRDKKCGGTLRINMAYVPNSLYPPAIHDAVTAQVVSLFHAGLVKFNPSTLEVLPSIAQKWVVDTSNKVFTFYLRKNARFHDDECFPDGKGRFITAKDFVYTFEVLCMQDSLNFNFGSISNILGATKYYDRSIKGKPKFELEGVHAVNDSVLTISIEEANPAFVNILANPAFSVLAKEAVEKYGSNLLVGAGSFVLKEKLQGGIPAYFSRFEDFYVSDKKDIQLPYLDTVKVNFTGSSRKELNLFFDGQIDMIIGLTKNQMPQIVEDRIKDFEAKPPKYILSSATEKDVQLFNLLYPYVKGFYTNGMNYIDLSIVYFENKLKDTAHTK